MQKIALTLDDAINVLQEARHTGNSAMIKNYVKYVKEELDGILD